MIFGYLSAVIAGFVLTAVPNWTTPFVLLAAVCFARGSRRLHAWLKGHPVFGPAIGQWQKHGAVSRPAKRAAVVAMATVPPITFLLGFPLYAAGLQCVVLALPAAFICSRPLPSGDDG